MKTNETISIIVPVYKVEPYLRQCLDSIVNQTYKNLEILLIDDGSPDRCGKICDEYGETDDRIHVFHTENGGVSAARNFGLEKSTGQYIGFVDSDDWIEPDMFEVLLKKMKETDAEIAGCGLIRERSSGSTKYELEEEVIPSDDAVKRLVAGKIRYEVWNKLCVRDMFRGVSFPSGDVYEDVTTTTRLLHNAQSVAFSSRLLYHYRIRENSISRTNSVRFLLDYWDAYYNQIEELSRIGAENWAESVQRVIRKNTAAAAAKVWRDGYPAVRKEWVQNREKIREISSYVKKNYPVLGERDWEKNLRCSIFFARYPTRISFALCHCIMSIVRKIRRQ